MSHLVPPRKPSYLLLAKEHGAVEFSLFAWFDNYDEALDAGEDYINASPPSRVWVLELKASW
jgi:hypothetical protein